MLWLAIAAGVLVSGACLWATRSHRDEPADPAALMLRFGGGAGLGALAVAALAAGALGGALIAASAAILLLVDAPGAVATRTRRQAGQGSTVTPFQNAT